VNLRLWAVICFVLVGIAPIHGARPHAPSKTKASDSDYVAALATANRFLNAWQTGDLETGMVLLSDRARRSQSADALENLFSRTSDRAFEINHGKCERGACHFPIVMLTGDGNHIHRKFSEIVLVNAGKADWVVDKLP
jgi:hypothetical protein